MTPHDEFNRDMWWLIRAIKKEVLAFSHEDPHKISHKIAFTLIENKQDAPIITTQRNLLNCLQGWQVLHFEELKLPGVFQLTINKKRFEGIYGFFENGFKFGIEGAKLYELASYWISPMSNDGGKMLEAWKIASGRIEPSQRSNLKSGVPHEPLFKIPTNAQWEDIEIKFKNHFDIEVFLKKKFFKSCDYQELGFFKSRTKDNAPDRQWDFLRALAAIYAVAAQQKLNDIPAGITDLKKAFETEAAVMTIKKKLSQQLRAVFGMNSDPFEEYDNHGYYQTKFKLTAEPELRRDHLFEFGESYDDSKLY